MIIKLKQLIAAKLAAAQAAMLEFISSRRMLAIMNCGILALLVPLALVAEPGWHADWAWAWVGFAASTLFNYTIAPLHIQRMSEEQRAQIERDMRHSFERAFEQAKRDGLVDPNATATFSRMQ